MKLIELAKALREQASFLERLREEQLNDIPTEIDVKDAVARVKEATGQKYVCVELSMWFHSDEEGEGPRTRLEWQIYTPRTAHSKSPTLSGAVKGTIAKCEPAVAVTVEAALEQISPVQF